MNTALMEATLVIVPANSGRFLWKNDDKQLVLSPDSLGFNTEYSITISAEAEDNYEHQLDGNGDGIGGDPYTLSFQTGHDVYGPELVQYYPVMN